MTDDNLDAAVKRQDDLREQGAQHRRELDEILATHGKEIREAEAARIDAIRAVDVGAVAAAAAVSATQATTLAAQVASSAEAMRNQVSATATAQTVALGAALDPIQKDIADLRRAQYEAQGQKTQVVETQARGGSWGLWVAVMISLLFFLVSAGIGVAGLLIAILRK
jgi:hypothetical protein